MNGNRPRTHEVHPSEARFNAVASTDRAISSGGRGDFAKPLKSYVLICDEMKLKFNPENCVEAECIYLKICGRRGRETG